MNVDIEDEANDGSGDSNAPVPPIINPPMPPMQIMNEMNLAMLHIGFANFGVRQRLRDEGLASFNDLKSLTEKDIRDVAETFGRRTANDGRFIFGIRRTRLLIGLVHWVQDFGRIGETPNMTNYINDANGFRDALDIALDRALVRKIELDQSDTVSKAADPGKFKDERKWPEWEPAFSNYLSTIPGVNGVPLSYVLRLESTPDPNETYQSFNEQAIACSPLTGASFQADARKVHQLLKSFLQSESAEQWIKSISRKQNGREDMIALRNHYSGEGNTSRRIAIAEKTRDTLHYKSERAMPFSSFLDKLQKMFNIFDEENESISETAKVRLLLKKVEHPQLQDAIGALRVRSAIDGISFTECANHLAALVSELPDQQSSRKLSSLNTDRQKPDRHDKGKGKYNKHNKDNGKGRKGLYMPDGTVWTGHYDEWSKMSDKDRQVVIDARHKKRNNGERNKRKAAEMNSALHTSIADLTRSIQAMKSGSVKTEEDTPPDTSAGNSFGGRQNKRSKEQ